MKQPAEYLKEFISSTRQHIFLTGKAGTGKTTLLNEIVRTTHKQTVVVAPTGIAALNAGGVTIHSMFQLPFATFLPDFGQFQPTSDRVRIENRDTLRRHFQMNKKRINLLRGIELLIIDEVSMLRADLLDAFDWVLRNVRRNNVPFGGVQVLFIGDLMQLPPVVKPEEWEVLSPYYEGMYFFFAHVIREQQPIYIELDKIYRQQDESFISLLNKLRNNQIGEEEKQFLNQYVQADFNEEKKPGYITLTTHNRKAQDINTRHLEALPTKKFCFKAEVKGEFPEHLYPIEENLELKKGAQIMFIKNDPSPEKNYFNGKMGFIESISEGEIRVRFQDEKRSIEVEKFEWENVRYNFDEQTQEIEEKTIGTFVQYPIRTAWAITVHKSQGLTFDKAVLDVSEAFAPGQAYVALSRLRSLEGLVLTQPFRLNVQSSDQHVLRYADRKTPPELLETTLSGETRRYLLELCQKTFDWPDLTASWRGHASTYSKSSTKSEKSKHSEWARHQAQKIEQLTEPARKFQNQLHNLFARESQLDQVQERIEAAYQYFFKTLDEVLYSLLCKMEEVKRKPKIAAYFEELEELDEQLTEVIIHLKRTRLLMERTAKGLPTLKDHLREPEILHYRLAKQANARQEARNRSTTLDFDTELEEEEEESIIPIKKAKRSTKKEKEAKKDTYTITLELLQQGKSVSEIAAERVMSEGTIYGHFGKLIQQEKLEAEAVIDPEKWQHLNSIFADFDGETLTEFKEKAGDQFSWDEIRIYRLSKIR